MPRIVVDQSRCEGHAVCEGIAPDVFALPDEGAVQVLIDEFDAGGAVAAAATVAVAGCPVAALHVSQ